MQTIPSSAAATATPAMPMNTMPRLQDRALAFARWAIRMAERFAPAIDLVIRVFVAMVFFKAGLTKIASWDNTIALFENEYMVPLLPPALAAAMATAAELGFPVLLVLGLGSRFAANTSFGYLRMAPSVQLQFTGGQAPRTETGTWKTSGLYWGAGLAYKIF